jgi:hypothetical protein
MDSRIRIGILERGIHPNECNCLMDRFKPFTPWEILFGETRNTVYTPFTIPGTVDNRGGPFFCCHVKREGIKSFPTVKTP